VLESQGGAHRPAFMLSLVLSDPKVVSSDNWQVFTG